MKAEGGRFRKAEGGRRKERRSDELNFRLPDQPDERNFSQVIETAQGTNHNSYTGEVKYNENKKGT